MASIENNVKVLIDKAMKEKIEELQDDIIKSYKAIIDKCIQNEGDWGECIYCNEGDWGSPEKHKSDCIVLKAEKYIKENH